MIKHNNFKIDFIGIGAPRAGTSWLGQCLAEHPQVNFAKNKETNFFCYNNFKFAKNIPEFSKLKCQDWKSYKALFSDNQSQIKGEFSPSYLYDEMAVELIKKTYPNAKIIVSLRNPVETVYSYYCHIKSLDNWASSYLRSKTFDQTWEEYNYFLPELGFFYKYFKRYFETFLRENIHVIIYDDIKKEPQKVIKELYKFLGIDDTFIPSSLNLKINKSKKVRFEFLLKVSRPIINIIEKFNLRPLIGKYFKFSSRIYSKIIWRKQKHPRINEETAKVLKKYYKSDIEKLEQLISRDLSSWKY